MKDFSAYQLEGTVVKVFSPDTKPTFRCLLLHGFPSRSHKNEDLAEALAQRAGTEVHLPHYPGLGDSAGQFSFGGAVDLSQAILERLSASDLSPRGA